MQLEAKVFSTFLMELTSLSSWLSSISMAFSFVVVLMFTLLQILDHFYLLDEVVELNMG